MTEFIIGLGIGLTAGGAGCILTLYACGAVLAEERERQAYERQALADALVEAGREDDDDPIRWEAIGV